MHAIRLRLTLRAAMVLVFGLCCFLAGWCAHRASFRAVVNSVNQLQKETTERANEVRRREFSLPEPLRGPNTWLLDREIAYPYTVQGVVAWRGQAKVGVLLGSDDGLRLHDHLLVHRDGQLNACLQVTEITPDACIGRVVMRRSNESVNVGDQVKALVDRRN